jgi:predicted DNA-binding transcriptional regulator AlpA
MDLETAYQPPRQFAQITGIPESTLAKLRMTGDGPPYVKIGRSVRYPVRAGLEWMAAHRRRSTSEAPQSRHRNRTRDSTPAGTPAE